MRIAFSLNYNSFGSFLIRWGTSEKMFGLSPCSHVMVLFDRSLVFHSNLSKGVHIQSVSDLPSSEVIVYASGPKVPLTIEQEEAIYQALIKNVVGNKYDILSLLFISFSVFMKKFFKVPMAKTNPMNSSEMDYCSEAISSMNDIALKEIGFRIFDQFDGSVITPSDLLSLLKKNESMEESQWKD